MKKIIVDELKKQLIDFLQGGPKSNKEIKALFRSLRKEVVWQLIEEGRCCITRENELKLCQ